MTDDYETIRHEINKRKSMCNWPERGGLQLLGKILLFIMEKIIGHRNQMLELNNLINEAKTTINQAKTMLLDHEARIRTLEGR